MVDPGCFTAEEALATPCFWVIVLTNLCMSIFTTGLQFHAAGLVRSGGGASIEIAYIFTPASILRATCGPIVQGCLVDNVEA